VRPAVALGLAVVVALAGAAAALSVERERLAGTNNVYGFFPNVTIEPGAEACAMAELVPGDTGAVRVRAEPAGPLAVRLVRDGRELANGAMEAGTAPVRPVVTETTSGVDVCFRNEGDAEVVLWGYGAVAGTPQRTELDGEPIDERVRLSYLRPGTESGWEIAGTVAHRMGIGRGSLLEGWAFFGWVLALGGALVITVGAVRR
jgi:hypothetical protein